MARPMPPQPPLTMATRGRSGTLTAMVTAAQTANVADRLAAHVGRHDQKTWDWDAFPASRGYPELARAQMRYIGAGGSPKVGDSSTLAPTRFTCSLIYLDGQRYAAVHSHEIEAAFW